MDSETLKLMEERVVKARKIIDEIEVLNKQIGWVKAESDFVKISGLETNYSFFVDSEKIKNKIVETFVATALEEIKCLERELTEIKFE